MENAQPRFKPEGNSSERVLKSSVLSMWEKKVLLVGRKTPGVFLRLSGANRDRKVVNLEGLFAIVFDKGRGSTPTSWVVIVQE